jgi:isopenicillin N synthase-like dioxygenase
VPPPHGLPLVDISGLESPCLEERRAVADALDRACVQAGFLHVSGSQIRHDLFDLLLARAKGWFAQDTATKMESYIGLSTNHSGYVPVGEEQFGTAPPDLKEAYDIGCDHWGPATERRPLLGPNLWPQTPGFREDVLACYTHLAAIGRQIMGAFALALGLDEDHFTPHLQSPPSQLRLIHYLPTPDAQDAPGIGAHTDYECFTLLHATSPGLQVVDGQGQWADVPLVDSALILNIGDMMEILSNGRYLATRHRVKRVEAERYSFPFFFSCDYDYVVAPVLRDQPPAYAPLKGGEHLFNQTAQTFAYLKRRLASGDLVLRDALLPGSFGARALEP